jgi:hypothetical protein
MKIKYNKIKKSYQTRGKQDNITWKTGLLQCRWIEECITALAKVF